MSGADGIIAFRRLTITFNEFRAKFPGPFANLVTGDDIVAAIVLALPDFKNVFFLEDAEHDRRGGSHAFRLHALDKFGGQLRVRAIGNEIVHRPALTSGKEKREHQRSKNVCLYLHCSSSCQFINVFAEVGFAANITFAPL